VEFFRGVIARETLAMAVLRDGGWAMSVIARARALAGARLSRASEQAK